MQKVCGSLFASYGTIWERGRGRERRGQRIWCRLCTDSSEPNLGLKLTNHKTMTWVKFRHSTNWAPQVPLVIYKWMQQTCCPNSSKTVCVWGGGGRLVEKEIKPFLKYIWYNQCYRNYRKIKQCKEHRNCQRGWGKWEMLLFCFKCPEKECTMKTLK